MSTIALLVFVAFSDNKAEDEWPLGERELEEILKSNCADLVKFLETDNVILARMYENGCITKEQMNHLRSKRTQEDRNRATLDILKRRSLRSYRQFVDCLKQGRCNNTKAIRILEHDEGSNLATFHSLSVYIYLLMH